jgi:hypothetical protein
MFDTRFREELKECARREKQSQATVKQLQSSVQHPLSQALRCAGALMDSTQSFDRICSSTGLPLSVVTRLNDILAQQLSSNIHGSGSGAPRFSARNQEIFTRTSLQPAKRFIYLLRQLELEEDHIRLVLFGEEDADRAKKLLLTLGTPKATVVFRRPTNNKSNACLDWVGIQPLFDQAGKHGVVPKASSAFWAALQFASSVLQKAHEIFPGQERAEDAEGGDRD